MMQCFPLTFQEATALDQGCVLRNTRAWVEKFIVGLNLCPYAKVPFAENTIQYVISDAKSTDDFIQDSFAAAASLLDTDPKALSTTLLIAPLFAESLGEPSLPNPPSHQPHAPCR